jgi:acetyl coenzyme A synthetase (ADP forming)-like protein
MTLLSPRSVAIIGASTQPGKVGHDILNNLVTEEFMGKIYPVNPKAGKILGVKAYPSVKDIPGEVDLAVIVIPAAAVPAALEECGQKGIKNAVVISAGFKEVHSPEGTALEEELVAVAERHGINVVGPNCLGILRPSRKMNASFAKGIPPVGNVTLISQSGATAVGIMDLAPGLGLGFASVFSIGNKSVMNESDFLALCAEDPDTHVIGLYLESIEDGRRFLETAASITPHKRIVLLKSGVSEHGKKAAASHTGALAGSDAAIDALCTQSGIVRARSMEEFLDLLCTLSHQPRLLTDNVAVLTNAGGPGILATDACEREGLALPALSPKIAEALKPALPDTASIGNPIDLIGDAKTDRYEAGLVACRDDAGIDGLVVILTPQIMTPSEEIADAIVRIMKRSPLMPVVACFIGGSLVERARAKLRAHGIPVFDTPERAVRAMAALRTPKLAKPPEACGVDERCAKARAIIGSRTGLLPERETQELFALFGLPTLKQSVAKNADEAVAMSKDIGFPLIAKISSKDIVHKTDVGGIVANLKSDDDVRKAFDTILANVKAKAPKAAVDGVLLQQYLPAGDEFIVGGLRDPSFGPLVMVGLGGIYTELFKDTSFRIGPVSVSQAYDMLDDLTSWKLLLGMRGKKQSDIDALADLVVRVGELLCACPAVKELDINPVLVSPEGTIVADAKVILG